ncbi:MAG TPA: OmpA family protein [Flavobacterium sp.]|jgi:outer membrane protein OmpA-like peptidoglycan-associated protein
MKIKFVLLFFLLLAFPAFSQQQFSVFFESNKHELTQTEKSNLDKWVATHRDDKIVGIYGFCDEDGSSGYNDTLAKKRIDNVFNNIKEKIKIREDFKTRSFGELHQLSKIKAENRKVTLYYIESKDIPRENEILGIKAPLAEKPKPVKKYPESLSFKNPNGTTTEYQLDTAFMHRIDDAKAGEKLKLENLNFQINTFAVMAESRAKMYELLIVLQNNPQLKIEIQGHLCCMPNDRLDLSTQRAKAIYNFLLGNEIDKKQLSYKGFGSTQPIYPIPEKNEMERAANRRVEIMIIEN